MNREFKFRAYEFGKMYYQVRCGGMFNGIATSPTNWNGQDWVNLTGGKHTKVMQYVGFRDSKRNKDFPNGQEIYEGDIDQYGYVVTYAGDLESNLGMNAGWYLQRDNFESWSELECNEDIEIIGNIFETPEKAINNCNTDYSKMF
jgi:hypothetical protein